MVHSYHASLGIMYKKVKETWSLKYIQIIQTWDSVIIIIGMICLLFDMIVM